MNPQTVEMKQRYPVEQKYPQTNERPIYVCGFMKTDSLIHLKDASLSQNTKNASVPKINSVTATARSSKV